MIKWILDPSHHCCGCQRPWFSHVGGRRRDRAKILVAIVLILFLLVIFGVIAVA